MRILGASFPKFLIVGAANFALTYAVYLAGLYVTSDFHTSIIIAIVVGTIFTTVLNIKYAFSSTLTRYRLSLGIAYYLVYTGVFYLATRAFVEMDLGSAVIAPLGAQVVLLPIHFLCSRRLATARGHLPRSVGETDG